MKWLSKKKGNEEISCWQTIVDILSALFLVILLISLLLILYILRIPEDTEPDPDPGNYTYETDSLPGDDDYDTAGNRYSTDRGGAGDHEYHPVISRGGGGGDGNGHTGEGDYSHEDPGWGDFEGIDKAAVYVRLVDAGTGKVIREKDVVFTLYETGGKQELLTIYYPQKISYKEYATTEQGTFYFPDKVRLGGHCLKEVTEPYGYDASDEIRFEIEESHEWEEPYLLDVPLFPSRNVIRIVQTDAGNGAALTGGLYRVTAAEDIITADGTLRYQAGDELGEITCDENGNGVSQELYLGEYNVTQILPPEYYAASGDPVQVTVKKKQAGVQPEACVFECEQTAFALVLADELYPSETIRDAGFSLRMDGEAQKRTFVTDGKGSIRLTGLAPGAAYTLRQESAASFYICPEQELTFAVDERGLIDGSPDRTVRVTNRMLRTTVLIRDAVLRTPISDCGVSLFDESGKCTAQWTSSGNPHELNGLKPGTYRLVMPGTAREMNITVTDRPEIQAYEFSVLTTGSIAGLCAGGLLLLGGGVFIVIRTGRKHRKRG